MPAGGWFSIEVRRGDVVESVHRVHAVIADRNGSLSSWGDRQRPTIPRSAIKSIQALPIVTTGAADALAVTQNELALACASHSGEPEHVKAVLGWLDRLGLSEADLECGPDVPMGTDAKKEFYASGREPSPIYNCCSGKHAGFLTVARHLGHGTVGYVERSAQVQQLVTEAIGSLTGLDLSEAPWGHDGCGIPVFALPLERLAFAMARLVDPVDLHDDLAAAAERLVEAAQRAFWVSGTDRTEVAVTDAALEPVVLKTGAEGVFMVGLPERGVGLALKVADGASRAARAAVRAVLGHLDVLDADASGTPPLRNKAGREVGELRPLLATPMTTRLSEPATVG